MQAMVIAPTALTDPDDGFFDKGKLDELVVAARNYLKTQNVKGQSLGAILIEILN